MLATVIFAASFAFAQTPAATPCDPNYYDVLESRAWLEAQREITQNQNLIFKPDSVFEYTCFDKFLGHLANQDYLFSNGTKWPDATTAGTDMTTALQNLVGVTITNYLSGNFNHPMLGGQLTTLTYAPAAVTPADYACDMMIKVWQTETGTAKCRDFIQDPAFDGFYTFAEYQASGDKRHLPAACTGIPDRWKDMMDIVANTAPVWTEDPVVTYLDRMDPAQCGDASNPPIMTGLKVIRNQTPNDYDEKVCITPGCVYDPGSDKCTN